MGNNQNKIEKMKRLTAVIILFLTACNNNSKPTIPQYQKGYLNKLDSICLVLEEDAIKGLCPSKLGIELLNMVDVEGTLEQKNRVQICKMRLEVRGCLNQK